MNTQFWEDVKTCIESVGVPLVLTQHKKKPTATCIKQAISVLKQNGKWIVESESTRPTVNELAVLLIENYQLTEENEPDSPLTRDMFFDWCMTNDGCLVNISACVQLAGSYEDKQRIINHGLNANIGYGVFENYNFPEVIIRLDKRYVVKIGGETQTVFSKHQKQYISVDDQNVELLPDGSVTVQGERYFQEEQNEIQTGDILSFAVCAHKPFVVVHASPAVCKHPGDSRPFEQHIKLKHALDTEILDLMAIHQDYTVNVQKSVREVYKTITKLSEYRFRSSDESQGLFDAHHGFYDISVIEYILKSIFRFRVVTGFSENIQITDLDNFVGCILNLGGVHYACISHVHRPIYIEKQEHLMCGMHALNNLLQKKKIGTDETSNLFVAQKDTTQHPSNIGGCYAFIDSLNLNLKVGEPIPDRYCFTDFRKALPEGIHRILYVFQTSDSYVFRKS